MNVGNGRAVRILAIEKVQLILNLNIIILDDCYYCLFFLMNIIFIGFLAKDGYNFSIKECFCDIIWMVSWLYVDN